MLPHGRITMSVWGVSRAPATYGNSSPRRAALIDEDDEVGVGCDTLSLEQDGKTVILTLNHDTEEDANKTFAAMKECLDDGILTISLSLEGNLQ